MRRISRKHFANNTRVFCLLFYIYIYLQSDPLCKAFVCHVTRGHRAKQIAWQGVMARVTHLHVYRRPIIEVSELTIGPFQSVYRWPHSTCPFARGGVHMRTFFFSPAAAANSFKKNLYLLFIFVIIKRFQSHYLFYI